MCPCFIGSLSTTACAKLAWPNWPHAQQAFKGRWRGSILQKFDVKILAMCFGATSTGVSACLCRRSSGAGDALLVFGGCFFGVFLYGFSLQICWFLGSPPFKLSVFAFSGLLFAHRHFWRWAIKKGFFEYSFATGVWAVLASVVFARNHYFYSGFGSSPLFLFLRNRLSETTIFIPVSGVHRFCGENRLSHELLLVCPKPMFHSGFGSSPFFLGGGRNADS